MDGIVERLSGTERAATGTVIKMMSRTKTGLGLLQDVLAAYGGDRTRWPAHVRLELSQLLTVSPEARRQLAEAQALDKLLDMAPAVPEQRVDTLAQRILAQAARSPRVVTSNAPVQNRRPAMAQWRSLSAGMAALAASLMIGVLAGQSSAIAPAVGEIADAAGLGSTTDSQQFAQFDDADVVAYEEAL
ncbi:MAG TPA: hypothetical protein PKD49_09585 [Hyphomicrobium sp.]|nr:hypothetical protein [Hyphomicrobium sp.]